MRTLFVVAAGLLAFTRLEAAPRDGVSLGHYETLRSYSAAPVARGNAIPGDTSVPVALEFDALGRRYTLELEPNTALVSPAARARLPGNLSVLRGRIAGEPDSWARITLVDGVPSGLIFDGRDMIAIDRPDDSVVAATAPVVYRLADLQIEQGVMACGTGGGAGLASAAAMYDDMVSELRTALAQGPGAVEEIEIGTIGDSAFAGTSLDPQGAILDRMNRVDGIYSSELGVQVTVPLVEILDAGSDPFTDTTDSDALIDVLDDYRFDNPPQRELGLTHLFTGQILDGQTVGVAYIGTLCHPRFGVGLTEARRTAIIDSLVAAHEIGHNFGADHDGDPEGSCPDAPDDQFIMAATVNGGNTFSECSKSIMLAEAAAASCISPLPSVDMTVTSFGQPESALLGNAINLTFDVDNRGSITAENVSVQIGLPDNVELLGASSSQGNCSSGAATVSCAIGSVTGASGVDVILSADTTAPGPASFSATVTATTDDNANNDDDLHVVTVEPAVDLVASSPAGRSVVIDQTVSATVDIENTSVLGASDIAATVTFDNGLEAESASWTAGTCTVGIALVECTAGSLAAQSTSRLTLGIRGTLAGMRGYTVQLDASETDANPADNSVSGSVSVTAAAQSGTGGGGGGGSAGLLLLALLGLGIGRRLRAA